MADATIIAASLNSEELEKSVNQLVAKIDNGLGRIKSSFDSTIAHMKRGLQELGSTKVDMGGSADGGSTRRASSVRRETDARKELVTTLDQQAKAVKEAYKPTSAQESYYNIVKRMRENVAMLSREIKSMPSLSLDRQFSAYMQYERQIEQVRQKIAELRQQLNELGREPNGNRLVIRQTVDEINASQQRIVQLEKEQIMSTRQIAEADRQALATKKEQYDRQKQSLIELSAGSREVTALTNRQAQAQQQVTQSAKEYSDQIRRVADTIRASDQWKTKGSYMYETERGHYMLMSQSRYSLEEQIAGILEKQRMEKSQLTLSEQEINSTAKQVLDTERQITQEQEKRKKYKTPSMWTGFEVTRGQLSQIIQSKTGKQAVAWDEQTSSIKKLSEALRQYQDTYKKMTSSERNSPFGKQMISDMQVIERSIKNIRAEMSRPLSFDAVKNLPVKTLDDMAYKIQRLQSYKRGINITDPKSIKEIRDVDGEINKLTRDLNKYMATTRQVSSANNVLGRSWNYMKNRLAFYFTVGASTQFVKQLIDIRGQYELLERSIGILIDSAQNGSKIFSELNSMAIKSPFTTMELGAAAKQLVAYDVEAKDVVDTTRRLADMAAAVGIPIERLTYALGQIKAYGYLNARDARMFANAGIPLVKQLADRYTELEGRLVSTADVYDRIKKKAISYEDVMETVNKMTDEGGKFFNFQEKAADTLKVRIANLTLAWNNMLNEIGKDSQGILSGGLTATKKVFENWRNINNMMLSVVSVFGLLKAAQFMYLTLSTKTLTATRMLVILNTVLGKRLATNLSMMGASFMKFISNPLNLAVAAIAAISVALGKAIADYSDLKAENEKFNKSIIDSADENIKSIDKFFDEYKEQFAELGSANKSDQQKLWERLREEIDKTTKNAKQFVQILEGIPDTVARIEFGKNILSQTQAIEKEAKRLASIGLFDIGGGFADDSLAKNLQKVDKQAAKLIETYGSLAEAEKEISTATYTSAWSSYRQYIGEANNELGRFTSNLDKANIGKIMGDDPSTQLANIREFANIIRDSFLSTEEGQKITAEGQARLNDALDEWVTKQAVSNNVIKDINVAAVESSRTAWEVFFDQLSRSDKERLDYLVETNQTGSDDFRELWDKATKEMSENATTSYNLIQDQIAKLRETPDIVINVVYKPMMGDNEELDPQRKAFRDKYLTPQNEYVLNQDSYFKEKDRLTRKYGRFIKKEGEDNVEWEKRLGQQYEDNRKSLSSLNNMLGKSANMSDIDKKAKIEERQALEEENKVLLEIQKNQGFNFEQFEKGRHNKKGGGSKKDLILEALKEEVSLVEKLQGDYDKLSKSGASQVESLAIIQNAYSKTVDLLNTKLESFGLHKVDLSLIKGKDPNRILKHFEDTLNDLVSKGLLNLERSREIEAVIEKFTISAKTYNLEKITKGLNSELDKLKDEYELAVELDANPELGDIFMDMMGIDKEALSNVPKTYEQVADEAQRRINNVFRDNGIIKAFDLRKNLDKNNFAEWAKENGQDITDNLMQELSKYVEWVNKVRLDDAKNQVKAWNELLRKYAEFEYRRRQISQDALKERIDLVNKLGSKEQKNYVARIRTKIDAADDPAEINRLKGEIESVVSDITKDNEQAARVAVSIMRKENEESAKLSFEEYKKGDDWIAAMGDSANLTSKALRKLISDMQEFIALNPELSATEVKDINEAIEKMRQNLVSRNPFATLGDSLQNVKTKTDNLKKAQAELAAAKIKYNLSKLTGNYYKMGKAQENVRVKTEKVNQAERELNDAQGDLYENIRNGIEKVQEYYNIMTNLQNALGETANQAIQAGFSIAVSMTTAYEAIKKGERSVAILAIIQAALTAINFLAGVFGRKKDTFTPLKEQLEALTDVMGKVSQAQLEALGKMTGSAAVRKYRELKENNDLIVASYRQLAVAAGKSGSSVGSHSYAYRTNKALAGSWEKISSLIGKTVTSVQDLFWLTPEELKTVMEGVPVEWSKMSSQIREALEGIIEYGVDKAQEYTDALAEALTNMSLDDLTNDFESMLQDMDSTAETFAENFEEYMRNAIIRSMLVGTYAEELETWYKHFQERISDDSLSDGDVEDLRQEYMDIVNRALAERNRLLDVVGGGSTADLSALQQGIQGITEETASALEAYMNSVSQQVYLHSSLLTDIRDAVVGFDADIQISTMAQMLLQLQQSYQVQMSIHGILEGVLNASGRAFQVELL